MKSSHLYTTIAVVVTGCVDLVFVLTGGTGSSISNFLVNTGYASPPVVFMIAFLCGHLFGPMRKAALCEKCEAEVKE